MAISYVLGFNPIWYFPDLNGLPLAGGLMFTYDGTNINEYKPVYMDAAGLYPWPQPIVFDANGTQGPFYFQVDSVTPGSYFLVIQDAGGVEQRTISNYDPTGGSSGGVTEFNNLNNLIINGQFLFNSGSDLPTPVPTGSVVAQGPSSGLIVPDITFFKSNVAATDTITFPTFPLGLDPVAEDETPPQYFNYSCTNAVTEGFKYLQFPISANVKNMESQEITVSINAASPLSNTLSFYSYQYYGFNGSPPNMTLMQTFNLTPLFTRYENTFVIPNTSGMVIGPCGDSYVAILVGLQTGVVNQTQLYNMQVVPGAISPPYLYETLQQVAGELGTPRTGDIKISTRNTEIGWLPMNNGTIGSATSGATARPNIDTFPLYYYLWNTVSNLYAPVLPGGRGISAFVDFAANKTISLTVQAGSALAGIGPGFVNGQNSGSATQRLIDSNLPPHSHTYLGQPYTFTIGSGATSTALTNLTNNTGNGPGSSTPFSILSPTTFRNVYIKL